MKCVLFCFVCLLEKYQPKTNKNYLAPYSPVFIQITVVFWMTTPIKKKQKKRKPWESKIIEFNGFDLIRSNFILHTRYITYSLKMTPKVTILQNRWKITMVNLIFLWALKPMGLFKGIFKSLNVQLLEFLKQFNCKACWPKNPESGTQHSLRDHIST